MIKILIIYFIVVIFTTLVAYLIDLYNNDEEMQLIIKRVILLIMGYVLLFFLLATIKIWVETIRNAITYMEIVKTTLINGFYFINSILLGSSISRKMLEIKEELYNIKLKKFLREKKEEKK